MSADKRYPYMKFYARDWRGDGALRMCSFAARGLWIDLVSLMHDEGDPYGHLTINGVAPTPAQLGRMLGALPKDIEKLTAELEGAGIFSRSDAGTIYSRRMVRDKAKAEFDQANGKRGGNPTLNGGVNPRHKLQNQSPEPETKEEETPSLRSGGKPAPKRKARSQLPDDFPLQADLDWAQTLWLGKGRADLCTIMADEVAKFRDHHSNKLTAGADWPACWRTWARNAIKFSNGAHNGRSRQNGSGATSTDKHLDGIASLISDIRAGAKPGAG